MPNTDNTSKTVWHSSSPHLDDKKAPPGRNREVLVLWVRRTYVCCLPDGPATWRGWWLPLCRESWLGPYYTLFAVEGFFVAFLLFLAASSLALRRFMASGVTEVPPPLR